MPRSFHSTLILVIVFVLGLAAGVSAMVWAWPGVHNRYMRPRHLSPTQRMTKSLQLTPAQVPQVAAVFSDVRTRSHQIYLQFLPQYAQACAQFNQTMSAAMHQESQAFEPIRQQENDKLRSILSPQQWANWQTQLAGRGRGQRSQRQDPCKRILSSSAPQSANHPAPQHH